jgi:hypothetical protein
MVEDIAKAVDVTPARLNVYKVSESGEGLKAHVAIYASPAAGSGIPGIEPRSNKDIALDLIAQVST